MTTIQNFSDIQKTTTPELVELYNKITGNQIKKFSDRGTAEKRTWAVVEPTLTQTSVPPVEKQMPKATVAFKVYPKVEEPEQEPVEEIQEEYSIVTEEKPQATRRRMNFCFMPSEETREIREGSKRRRAFDMMNTPEGTTFNIIARTFNWSSQSAYECIRLIHLTAGWGIWSEYFSNGDINVRIVGKEEYLRLHKERKLKEEQQGK